MARAASPIALTASYLTSKLPTLLENPVTLGSTDLPPTAPQTPPGPPAVAGSSGATLDIVNLGKSYQHHGRMLPILWDVNLSLAAGEMASIVGSSGVGKSTFLQVLGTLDVPTTGSILFNGRDVSRLSKAALAQFRNRNIGFVFQFHHLLPDFTALENVMMPCLIAGVARPEAMASATALLTRVGLAHRLGHKPGELSGGEQQRVAIARALVMKPPLVLADEPTGNLDPRTGHEIRDLFVELNREVGSTLLVVTHNVELARMMPRCLRMTEGGQLREDAPPSAEGEPS